MVEYKGFRVPEWKNKGTEPIEEFRKTGWKISQKPPSEYFNWFFSSTYDSIKKLIDDQDAHSKLTNNPHKVTSEQVNTYNKQTIDGKVKKVNDDLNQSITNHTNKTDNPHKVTAAQTGAYTKSQTDAKINETKETITQETDAKVSNLDSKLTKTINEHASRTDNPHEVTAAQTGAYTKEQTDEAIKNHIPEIPDIDLSNYDTKPEVDEKIETAIDQVNETVENNKIETDAQIKAVQDYATSESEKHTQAESKLDKRITQNASDISGNKEMLENHNSHISWMLTNKLDKTGTAIKAERLTPGFSINDKVTDGTIDVNLGSHDVGAYTQAEVDELLRKMKDYVQDELDKRVATWTGTYDEYNQLSYKDPSTIYYIHD